MTKKCFLLLAGLIFSCSIFAIDAPNLSSPANGSTNQPVTITLDWTSVTGNEGYLYQLDTVPSFDSPLLLEGETVTNSSQIGVSNLYFGKTYYWRAATKSGVEVSDWSATWSFTTVGIVSNSLPSNEATNQPVTVEIDWNGITGNTGYIYQIDTLATFDSPLLVEGFTGVNASSVYVNDLFFGTTYYWRAAAKNAVDTSEWSSAWSFTTIGIVSNSLPSNGAVNQPVTVEIDWNGITGNTGYIYQIDTLATFDSPLLVEGFTGTNASSVYVNDLFFGTTYYWRAAAKNAVDTSEWSVTWNFTTVGIVSNSLPSNGATNQPVTVEIDWNGITGNTGYIYQIDTLATFDSPLLVEGFTGVNASSVYVNDLFFGTTYHWRAAAKNAVDTSEWSVTWNFTTVGIVSNSLPSNGATNQPVTVEIDWNGITGNTGYLYQIDTLPTFDSPLLAEGFTGTNASSVYVNDLFFGTTYYWRAAAKNAVDTSEWSVTWNFTTIGIVSNSLPSNGATNQPVTVEIDWNGITGNTGYIYQIDTLPTFDSPLLVEGYTGVNASSVYVNDLFFGTTYYWRAAAKNAVDTSDWSSAWNFTTANLVNNITPSNGATNISINPSLDWGSITGSSGYLVAIDTSYIFNSDLYQEQSVATSQASYSGLLYGTTYYWHAAARDAVDTSSWSAAWSFTTAYELTESPVLVSPVNSSTDLSYTNVGFIWEASTGAVDYQYQVSLNEDFTAIIKSTTTSLVSGNVTGLYPHSTYYWRVRGANANGYSPWSEIWNFTTESADLTAPVLVSPVNEATDIDIDNVTLDWNSVYGASAYIFEITEDEDFISGITTQQVSETYKVIIGLSNGTQYFWRVKATDGAVESDWSEVWNFTTEFNELEPPVLVAPSNYATEINPESVLLDWNSVAGASQYVYDLSTDNTFSTEVTSETINETEKTLTGMAEGTQYFWRVKATDGVLESEWSEVWNFTTLYDELDAPVLVSPTNNATEINPESVLLDWNSVAGASQYVYEISTDNTFNTGVTSETINETEKTLTLLDEGTQYFWRVKATDGVLESGWSEIWNFTTESAQQYTLTVTIEGSGIVLVDDVEYTEPITVDENTTLTLFAEIELPCHFIEWSGDLNGNNNPEQILMDADKNVTATFDVTKVEETSNDNFGITIYPNPANDYFTISGENIIEIEIFNITGQLVYSSEQISGNREINVKTFEKGAYLVKITSDEGVYIERLIIQ